MVQNDSLARAVISAFAEDSRQTRWAQFLQLLGADKPGGLYFDMLGTDAGGKAGVVRIALSGWADNESRVTDLIGVLQKSRLCSGVSLSSIDKSDASDVFLFRILCSLHLVAGLPAK
jgi:Tfp pilus assembly protein PilN